MKVTSLLTSPTTLYRFYNADAELLYIGITVNFDQRRTAHRAEKSWWPEVASHTLTKYPCRLDAAIAERESIVAEKPFYNVHHHPDLVATTNMSPNGWREADPWHGLTEQDRAALITHIKDLGVDPKEAREILHDMLIDLHVISFPLLAGRAEVEEARAAQAKRIARGVSDPLPQGAP